MNSQSMKDMFERLNDGKRIGNQATDKRMLAQQPETVEWDNNRDGYLDYMTYATSRAQDGKSHEEAVAYVEKLQAHR